MYNYGSFTTPTNINNPMVYSDDRFFGIPFLVGGIAGTALGYGIANNQSNQADTYYPVYPVAYPTYYTTYPTYPTYSTSNNYYY